MCSQATWPAKTLPKLWDLLPPVFQSSHLDTLGSHQNLPLVYYTVPEGIAQEVESDGFFLGPQQKLQGAKFFTTLQDRLLPVGLTMPLTSSYHMIDFVPSAFDYIILFNPDNNQVFQYVLRLQGLHIKV